MTSRVPIVVMASLWIAVCALAQTGSSWESGKIIRAEQPERKKPEPYEVWNPMLTHWYTIEGPSVTIRATEMVPAGVKRRAGTLSGDADRNPPMAFQAGETVRFRLQAPPPDPKKKREVHVVDRKGKTHILTVDELVPGSSRNGAR